MGYNVLMLFLTLEAIKSFVKIFEKGYLRPHKFTKIDYSQDGLSKIYIVDDELVLLVQIAKNNFPKPTNYQDLRELIYEDGDYCISELKPRAMHYILSIVELSPNVVGFDFELKKFTDQLEEKTCTRYLKFNINYNRFKGWDRPYWNKDEEILVEQIHREMPELKLRERYEKWQGDKYNFIIINLNTRGNEHVYAVAYTRSDPETYMGKLARRYIERGNLSSMIRGDVELEKALKTLLTKKRYERLNHITYTVVTKYFREKDAVWQYADELLAEARAGEFDETAGVALRVEKPSNRFVLDDHLFDI